MDMELLVSPSNGETTKENLVHKVLLVPCRKVRPFPGQPRHYFDRRLLQELADSINEVGQTTPALVRQLEIPEDGYEFELVDGERRFRACIMLNRLFKVEVDTVSDKKQQFRKSVAANYSKESHTPVESALAIKTLREEHGETIESVARIMGMSVSWVTQYSNLLRLDPEVLKLLEPENTPEEKLIAVNVGFLLVNVPMPDQLYLARRISNQRLSMDTARHLINATLAGRGITNTNFRPKREFWRIAFFARKSNENLDGILGMSEVQFQHILKLAGLQPRMELLEQVSKMEERCNKLKKNLKKILENM